MVNENRARRRRRAFMIGSVVALVALVPLGGGGLAAAKSAG
jgi:hypothetical protein